MNLKASNKLIGILLFSLGSFFAGGVNGFLGTGGGILFVFLLSYLTKNERKNNYVTTLCATIPISLVGIFAYFNAGTIDFSLLKQISIPTVLGGFFGAILVSKLNVKWLNAIFSLLIIYSGINMIIK